MALDESKEGDEIIEDKGLTFLIEKVLMEEAKPITVDFIVTPSGSGFKLTSPFTAGGSDGCGGSCSSC